MMIAPWLLQFWQNFETSLQLLIPNYTRYNMINYTKFCVLYFQTYDECVLKKDLECVGHWGTFFIIPFFCGYFEECQ